MNVPAAKPILGRKTVDIVSTAPWATVPTNIKTNKAILEYQVKFFTISAKLNRKCKPNRYPTQLVFNMKLVKRNVPTKIRLRQFVVGHVDFKNIPRTNTFIFGICEGGVIRFI